VRRSVLLALAVLCASTGALAAEGDLVTLVACPIFRDTNQGAKSGCWLADDHATGVRYDITLSLAKADWNHEALVEGRISHEKDVCGGIVLTPVRVSILPGNCTPRLLPAEGMEGHRYKSPTTNLAPIFIPRPAPAGPYTTRDFTLLFDFDQTFLIYQYDDYWLDQAVTWAKNALPQKIIVTGYAATHPAIVSGRSLREEDGIARARAEEVTTALVRMGLPQERIVTQWQDDVPAVPELSSGLPESSKRRVTITMQPAPDTAAAAR
jgi:outer membrane protein OmpA-like peptidoglycan-associated protein